MRSLRPKAEGAIAIEVDLTATAVRQVRDLRAARRKADGVTLVELRDRGCAAAGYRLSGEVNRHVCCRHLYGTDRMLTVWPADDHAVMIAIGRHDESAADVYCALMDALDLEVPEAEREKPPCCDDVGRPPSDEHVATVIAEAVERVRRRVRRQRR